MLEIFEPPRLIDLSGIDRLDRLRSVPRTFGQNLQRLRLAQRPKVTQQALARALGHANNSTISKWETENVLPEPETITKVAAALKVDAAALLEDVIAPYDRLRGFDLPRQSLGVQHASGPATAATQEGGASHDVTSARLFVQDLREDLRHLRTLADTLVSEIQDVASRIDRELATAPSPHTARPSRSLAAPRPRRRRKTG